MTRHTSQPSIDTYDLGRIFIGRQQQLDLFDYYLTRWQQLLFAADPDSRSTPPSTSACSARSWLSL